MTPDLKRLCEAAASKALGMPVSHDHNASEDPEDWEAIVRAILTALREPSDDARAAMDAALDRPRQHVGHRGSDEVRGAYIALDAYVDHILDTKARRASALSDLAELDGETL